jgi:hypothetical protein
MKLHLNPSIRFAFVLLALVFATQATAQVRAQKIGDNPSVINADAALEVAATDKGFLAPRVALTSTTSPSPLGAHVVGMLVYNTATTTTGSNDVTPGLYENNGSSWILVSDTSDNLGDHTATQNLDLATHKLVGNGGTEGIAIDATGNVGMGTTTPQSKLVVDGAAINNGAFDVGAATTIDFSESNLAYTTASAGAFTLQNLINGGTYTLAVKGATSGTSSFTASGFTFHSVSNRDTKASTHTLYTFIVMGTDVYYSMTTGL